MTRQKFLFILAIIAVIMLGLGIYVQSKTSRAASPSSFSGSNTNAVKIEHDGMVIEFEKERPTSESFMLFGFQHRQSGFNDGYLGGIPLQQAKKLLRKYPQMSRCGAPGSKEAQKAIKNYEFVAASSEVQKKLAYVAKEYDESMRQSKARVCVKITGYTLKQRPNQEIQIRGEGIWFALEDITTTSCL